MDLQGDGGVPRRDRPPYTDSAQQRLLDDLAAALAASRSGDDGAIVAIYAALHPRLLRYLRHRVGPSAPDVASEVWLSLTRELPRFDGDSRSLSALMYTIARRRVVDHHRRSSRRPRTVPLDPTFDWPDTEDPVERVVDHIGAQNAVRMVADELPADQAEIVLLRVLGHLDAGQVASIVGKTPGAVRVAEHRAVRRLREVQRETGVTT